MKRAAWLATIGFIIMITSILRPVQPAAFGSKNGQATPSPSANTTKKSSTGEDEPTPRPSTASPQPRPSAKRPLTAPPRGLQNGRFAIVNSRAGFCVGNNGSGQSEIGSCTYDATQVWTIFQGTSISGIEYYQFMNDAFNCLGLHGGTGPQVVVGPCSSTSDHSQFWDWDAIIDFGVIYDQIDGPIRNGHTGDCAGLHDSSTASGTLIVTGGCSGSATQNWYATEP